MARNFGRPVVLGVLLVVLAAVLFYEWQAGTTGPVTPTPAARPRPAGKPGQGEPAPAAVPQVKMEALAAPRPEPAGGTRDLFRFEVKAPPPPPVSATVPRLPPPTEASGPPAPPPPPPIPLKFIGIVEGAPKPGKLAVLTDGRDVYYGKEGDLIEGRYRIIRIGVESIEMTYVDGRGRQVIRLSGG